MRIVQIKGKLTTKESLMYTTPYVNPLRRRDRTTTDLVLSLCYKTVSRNTIKRLSESKKSTGTHNLKQGNG